jgi:hypothetical protein
MSQAFMREREEEWLGNVDPTVEALARYLTKESNGVKVFEVRRYYSKQQGREVIEMSNGECYSLDMDKRWNILM